MWCRKMISVVYHLIPAGREKETRYLFWLWKRNSFFSLTETPGTPRFQIIISMRYLHGSFKLWQANRSVRAFRFKHCNWPCKFTLDVENTVPPAQNDSWGGWEGTRLDEIWYFRVHSIRYSSTFVNADWCWHANEVVALRQFVLTNRRTYVNKFVDPYLERESPVTQQKAKVGLLPGDFLHPAPCVVARALKTKDSLGSHLNCQEPLLHHLTPALCEYTLGCITLGPEVIIWHVHFLTIRSHT